MYEIPTALVIRSMPDEVTFSIIGVSVALAQELIPTGCTIGHPFAALLQDLRDADNLCPVQSYAWSRFAVPTRNPVADLAIGQAIVEAQALAKANIPLEVAQRALPVACKITVRWTLTRPQLDGLLRRKSASSTSTEIERVGEALYRAYRDEGGVSEESI